MPAVGLFAFAIRSDIPTIFLEHKAPSYETSEVTCDDIPLGRARIGRAGTDVTVVENCWDALDAAPHCLGAARTPIPYSEPLETAVVPSVDDNVSSVRASFGSTSDLRVR